MGTEASIATLAGQVLGKVKAVGVFGWARDVESALDLKGLTGVKIGDRRRRQGDVEFALHRLGRPQGYPLAV
jgi:hypothetical protein